VAFVRSSLHISSSDGPIRSISLFDSLRGRVSYRFVVVVVDRCRQVISPVSAYIHHGAQGGRTCKAGRAGRPGREIKRTTREPPVSTSAASDLHQFTPDRSAIQVHAAAHGRRKTTTNNTDRRVFSIYFISLAGGARRYTSSVFWISLYLYSHLNSHQVTTFVRCWWPFMCWCTVKKLYLLVLTLYMVPCESHLDVK